MGNARLQLVLAGLVLVVSVQGCQPRAANSPPAPAVNGAAALHASGNAAPGEGARKAPVPPECAKATLKGPLAWFSDDYPGALACARAAQKPLVIDLWAPWCHTCLSMKHTVLVDPGLQPLADRFVWLELDTDKEINADVQTKLPPKVWPTFYVIAPGDESVQARYLGAASVAQFREFLMQGEKGALAASGGSLPEGSPLAAVRAGDQAAARRDLAAADAGYSAALAQTPASWPRRPDVLVALISVRVQAGAWDSCAELAAAELGNTGSSASATDFAYSAMVCADKLDKAKAQPLRQAALARLRGIIDDPGAPMAIDDRGDAMRVAREIMIALGDEAGARAMAERQRALLDQAAAKAPNAFAAMTYNWPRAEVYMYLGKGKEIIPDLEKSMAALPNEYDPPHRLAWVHANTGNLDQALVYAEKARDLAYGPRKARVYHLLADIHSARGDRAAERAARQAEVELYRSLPEGQRQPGPQAAAEAALKAMEQQEAEAIKKTQEPGPAGQKPGSKKTIKK